METTIPTLKNSLGGAHAGCYTMSVASILSDQGIISELLVTKVIVIMIKRSITKIQSKSRPLILH